MHNDASRRGEPGSARGLFYYTVFVAASVVFLLVAGAMVTSTGSGLAVPDWPLSFGQLMPEMTGGVFYEHGHRMIATGVGVLMIGLALWTWRRDPRAWARKLGWTILGLVILQGLLGGATVLLKLPVITSATHACLAQAIFMLVIFLALAQSRGWNQPTRDTVPSGLFTWAVATTAAIYIQLILGAVTRHLEAGLVIPDWPLSFGGLVPPAFTPEVGVHFAHRTWAWGILVLVVVTSVKALRGARGNRAITGPAILLLVLTAIQISLGASIIFTQRQPHVTSTHVVTGALLLAVSLLLAARAWKHSIRGMARQSSAGSSVSLGKATA